MTISIQVTTPPDKKCKVYTCTPGRGISLDAIFTGTPFIQEADTTAAYSLHVNHSLYLEEIPVPTE